jgi:hypothetical protein
MAKRQSQAAGISNNPRWWLGIGDEECPHCGQSYAREVGLHCHGCDGACCPHCIVRKRKHNFCPDCIQQG